MRLVHLFTCLFCFSFSIGFGQSVYEDARKLKEELIGLKKKDSDTKVWLKLTKTLPFVFISDHQDQDRRDSGISYGLEFSIDPMSEHKSYNDDTDYLILPKGGLSDSLIVQSLYNPDDILFAIPIRHTYYILKQNNERLDLITPNGEYIANISLYDPMYDPIFITTSKKNAIYFDAREIYPLEFVDSKKTLDKFGNYIFYSIPVGDTVEISSAEGKLAILYNKEYTLDDSMCVKIINENKIYTVAPGEINIEYSAKKIIIYTPSEQYNININGIPTLTYNSYLPSEIYANVKQEAKDKKASTIQFFPDSVLIDKYYYEFILDSLHSENRKINQVILYRGKGIMKAFSFINPESFSLLNKNNGNNILLAINQRSDKIYTQEWSKKKRLLSEKTECLNLSRFFAYDFYKNKLIVSIDIDTFINLQYEIDSNSTLIKGVDRETIERYKNCQNGKYKFIFSSVRLRNLKSGIVN